MANPRAEIMEFEVMHHARVMQPRIVIRFDGQRFIRRSHESQIDVEALIHASQLP